MPDLSGMHIDAATALLAKKGMTLLDVRPGNGCQRPNVVCGQNPKPGHKSILKYRKTVFIGAPPTIARPEPTEPGEGEPDDASDDDSGTDEGEDEPADSDADYF